MRVPRITHDLLVNYVPLANEISLVDETRGKNWPVLDRR